MKKILLIASLDEKYYYLPFINAGKDKNIEIHIFDPDSIPEKAELEIFFNRNSVKIDGFIDTNKIVEENFQKSRIKISEIDVAWYLRERPGISLKEMNLKNKFAKNESRVAVKTLLATLECKWVNKKETIDFLSSNKLYQQIIAHRSGLITPDTLISNNAKNVSKFSRLKGDLLLKPLGYIGIDDKGEYFLYAQIFSQKEISNSFGAIKACPVFAQEYIKKRYEYRIMVIGNSVLSCRIDSQASEKTKIDWRHYDFENVNHSKVDLPIEIQKKLLYFMKKINLKYGAIDMIETPNGEFVFLEVNPSGQWGWIADLAKLPISEAVVNMLLNI